jgi:hypothetical protein
LLGTREDEIINIENLQKEIEKEEIFGEEHRKIRNALERHQKLGRKIILKPASTSSGHGQFAISHIDELKEKIKLLEYVKKFRVPNKFLIIEEFIEDPVEFCVIAAKTKKGNICLNGIYYQKYDPEKCPDKGFEGQSRLIVSKTFMKEEIEKQVRPLFLEVIPNIIKTIFKYLPVPFLYVEFLLDPKNIERLIINEISYRPDDAGFISLISHKQNQFELFMESLRYTLSTQTLRNVEEEPKFHYVEPEDKWACVTFIVYEKIEFPKRRITYETDEGRKEDHFKFRFYEKVLGHNEAVYRRIIGYQWHHASKHDEDRGERILKMHARDQGISEDVIETLIRALERTGMRMS